MRLTIEILLGSFWVFLLSKYTFSELLIIFRAFITLGLLAFIGTTFYLLLTKNIKQNIFLRIAGGMITGPLVFVFFLGILSYLFKGKTFLTILFYLFVIISIYLIKVDKLKEILFLKAKSISMYPILLVLMALNIFLIFNLVNQSIIGGDASIYTSIAMSFTRGNFPTMTPWQPDYWLVYHHGTFTVMGLLQTISGIHIDKVHSFFSFYLISAVFIFVCGVGLEVKKNIFSIIPAVFGLMLWGLPTTLLKAAPNQSLGDIISHWPTFNMISSISGTGAGSIQGAAYTIFTIFSLATFLVFVYILVQSNLALRKKYLLLTLLTIVNLSINETYFPIQVFLTTVYFIYEYRHQRRRKIVQDIIICLFIFIGLFFLIQNYIRDSLLYPAAFGPRTQVLALNLNTIKSYFDYTLKTNLPPVKLNGGVWHILDIRIVIFVSLIISIVLKRKAELILSLSAALCICLSIFIYSPYWNGVNNNLRYLNLAYQLTSFSFGITISYLVSNNKLRYLAFFVLILLTPQISSSYANAILLARSGNFNNYTIQYVSDPDEADIEKIDKILGAQDRLLLVSFTSYGSINPQVISTALGKYGLFIPIAPPEIKTPCPDRSVEWYDAVNYLDQVSLDKLKINYIYLDKSADIYLPEKSLIELKNQDFFREVFTSPTGRLVKPTDNYFKTENFSNNTLREMLTQVEAGKTVYIDRFDGNIEKPIILNLLRRTNLIANEFEIGLDYYLCNEAPAIMRSEIRSQLYKNNSDKSDYFLSIWPNSRDDVEMISQVDYAYLAPGVDANRLLTGNFRVVSQTQEFSFWKKI